MKNEVMLGCQNSKPHWHEICGCKAKLAGDLLEFACDALARRKKMPNDKLL